MDITDHFARVRSTVRENIGWSLVMVTTHPLPILAAGSNGAGGGVTAASTSSSSSSSSSSTMASRLVSGLSHVITTDQNIVSVGFAMDALHRLTLRTVLPEALAIQAAEALDPASCLRPEESLCRTAAQ